MDMKKTIKLKFVDFWNEFDVNDNEFLDALNKYFNVEQSEEPDYIIYSVFGYEHLHYDCIRIFYTGECQTPDFNECDYGIGFDRLSFGDRYARIPLYNALKCKPYLKKMCHRPRFTHEDIKDRGFCSFVVSNGFSPLNRGKFFDLLSNYKKVASGGAYKNNIGELVEDKLLFLGKYKFHIAFENTAYDGYTTEKIVDAFYANTVPIYCGDPGIAKEFNSKAFINVNDFPTFEAAIERIKEIDENEELYLQMLNEPVILPDVSLIDLEDFLVPIFQKPVSEARRRPLSNWSVKKEIYILRYEFLEKYVYKPFERIKNYILNIKQ